MLHHCNSFSRSCHLAPAGTGGCHPENVTRLFFCVFDYFWGQPGGIHHAIHQRFKNTKIWPPPGFTLQNGQMHTSGHPGVMADKTHRCLCLGLRSRPLGALGVGRLVPCPCRTAQSEPWFDFRTRQTFWRASKCQQNCQQMTFEVHLNLRIRLSAPDAPQDCH